MPCHRCNLGDCASGIAQTRDGRTAQIVEMKIVLDAARLERRRPCLLEGTLGPWPAVGAGQDREGGLIAFSGLYGGLERLSGGNGDGRLGFGLHEPD